MFEKLADTRRECIRQILRPVVGLCMRSSLKLQDLTDLLKAVFVEIAVEEMEKQGDKVNVSRLAVMTGVHRKDVTRMLRENTPPKRQIGSLLSRVIGQWEQDRRFTTSSGKPRVLPFRGEKNEFRELVHSASKNNDPGTVLFELVRLGAVEKTSRGAKLIHRVPRYSVDPREGFQQLADDMESLARAAEENIFEVNKQPNHHLRTEYDNIYKKDIPRIRKWLDQQGKAYHKKVRDYLSRFDKDVSPAEGEAGVRVTLVGVSHVVED